MVGIGPVQRNWADLGQLMAEWEARLARDHLAPIETVGRKDIVSLTAAVETRVSGSVWELSATVDSFAGALRERRFGTVVDEMISEMLSRAVPWHRIARTLRCSKRRVQKVSREVSVWRDQEADRLRRLAAVTG